jgi:hypothetical protein
MAYTTINKSNLHFNTITWSGTGSSKSETGVGFQPDMVWAKGRTVAGYNHYLVDSVRGSTKVIYSNLNNAEDTDSNGISSFDSNGYTFGTSNGYNNSSQTYVGWNWKANGSGSSNSDGSITSTVSANTTAGFSIVKWTGDGNTGATIGHGLGVKPNMIIAKSHTQSGTSWPVYHSGIGATKYLSLNSTTSATTSNTRWNNAEPTNQVFTVGSSGDIKTNGYGFVAYCFAEKTGYSKFGSYVGNGNADGTFIYTGFKPAFTIIKNISASARWVIDDKKRSPINEMNNTLFADGNEVEYTAGAYGIDYLSNGFKLYTTSANYNTSNQTYIYMAFAEAPLVGTNNIPCNAR